MEGSVTVPEDSGNVDQLVAQVQTLCVRVEQLLANRTPLTEDAILNRDQLADAFDVSLNTIWRWEKEGLPRLTKGRFMARYRFGDALAWLREAKRPRNRKPQK